MSLERAVEDRGKNPEKKETIKTTTKDTPEIALAKAGCLVFIFGFFGDAVTSWQTMAFTIAKVVSIAIFAFLGFNYYKKNYGKKKVEATGSVTGEK